MHKIAFFCFFLVPLLGYSETPVLVSFSNLNYEEALSIGKKENKLIFINYNATDVDPCKIMEETTFSNLEVINLLNDHFINIDANIDKKIGQEWIKKFGIECLPTFMILDNNGKLEGINQGTLTTPAFISWTSNMPSVKIKMEEILIKKEKVRKETNNKSDNLLAIKRKLKAAEGNYVKATPKSKKIDDDVSTTKSNTLALEEDYEEEIKVIDEEILIAEFKTSEITDVFDEIKEEGLNETIDADIAESTEITFIPEKVEIPHNENLENTSLTRTMSYSIQIGAYENYINAKNIMERSKDDFEKHYYILEEPTNTGNHLYKVVVGTYTSKEEAQLALKKLVEKGYNGFLRRI